MGLDDELEQRTARIRRGGAAKYHEQNAARGKLPVRERLRLLLDDDDWVEDGLHANGLAADLPADGVICGLGRVAGRTVAFMANDATVKAGSWGWRTVEKIIRTQEQAAQLQVPMLYLVDSAGARITDQVAMFPGRRGAGRIFHNQVQMSGVVPQVCLLFGPSAAGGAYIPAFCDVVIMVEGNASMYLGSPRMAAMVIGEQVSLEDMGGARMHCTVSGVGDVLVPSEAEAIAAARRYLGFFPDHAGGVAPGADPAAADDVDLEALVPANQNVPFDMYRFLAGLVDGGSFFEIKALFARELITGLARLNGRPVGIIASQPQVKGGVLFVDSADKAARFIRLCDAFGIPLLFLADVPGFMIGTAVERAGIIRHGAKMVYAVAEATVPKICVVVRKAYGAGLYAMCGPAFAADATLALPTAMIAVMGPEAAVNAVYAGKIAELPGEAERATFVTAKRAEYRADIDVYRLASDLVVDGVVTFRGLRTELVHRFAHCAGKRRDTPPRRHGVSPV